MNWDDPAERARLIETLGPDEYSRLQKKHFEDSIIAMVAGHAIRPVMTRFGRLYQVGATGVAFPTVVQAKAHARKNPAPAQHGETR